MTVSSTSNFVVLSFALGCCYSFSPRRGREFSIVRHATDVTDGFQCSCRHPLTPCNSPILTTPCNSPSLSLHVIVLLPPLLAPLDWGLLLCGLARPSAPNGLRPFIPNPGSIPSNRMLLLRRNSFPPPSKEKGWLGGRNYGNSGRLIFKINTKFCS